MGMGATKEPYRINISRGRPGQDGTWADQDDEPQHFERTNLVLVVLSKC